MVYEASYLPRRISGAITSFEERLLGPEDAQVRIKFPAIDAPALLAIIAFLRQRRREVLMNKSITDIIRVLDRAAQLWLDASYEPRQKAIPAISAITGYSPEMVAHSIDLEQRSSRRNDLWSALLNEFNEPACLDGFIANPRLGGHTRAIGPELTGAIFSANIPALPHLTVMRSFLVKSACLGKISSGEPLFLPLYAGTIEEIDPDLASCLAVIHWEHGNQEIERAFFSGIDFLIAYGSESSIQGIRSKVPPGLGALYHGHRLGFGMIAREALEATAAHTLAHDVAYDFTVFDQHACLAPHVYFVEEGGQVAVEEFAGMVAQELQSWADRLPARRLSPAEASSIHQLRAVIRMRMAGESGLCLFAPPDSLAWTLILEPSNKMEVSILNRVARIVPVKNLEEMDTWLSPLAPYIQNTALAASGPRLNLLRERLARLGATRITRPGLMGTPSMMWHHDGHLCLASMVRWCDEETRPPGEGISP